jgi:hypothetical protein
LPTFFFPLVSRTYYNFVFSMESCRKSFQNRLHQINKKVQKIAASYLLTLQTRIIQALVLANPI